MRCYVMIVLTYWPTVFFKVFWDRNGLKFFQRFFRIQ